MAIFLLRHCCCLQHSSKKCFSCVCLLSLSLNFFRLKSVLLLSNTLIRYACLTLVLLSFLFHFHFCALLFLHYIQDFFFKKNNIIRLLSHGEKKMSKVILLWHKWPARSVCDKRWILMEKSLCLFVSFLQVNGNNNNNNCEKNLHTRTLNNTLACREKCMQLAYWRKHIAWLVAGGMFFSNFMQKHTDWNK